MQSMFNEYKLIDDHKKLTSFQSFWRSYLACLDGCSIGDCKLKLYIQEG